MKIKGSYIYISLFVAGITFAIVDMKKTESFYANSPKINFEFGLDSSFIQHYNTSVRGVIHIKDIGYLPISCSLIFNPQNYPGLIYHGPINPAKDYKYVPTLRDVPVPYVAYKKANNDTLIVRKDSFYLYFKVRNFK